MTLHSNVSEIDPTQWNELVAKSPTASFFQTQECFDFYISLTFLKAFVFAVSDNGKLMGLVCGYIISEGNFIKRFFTHRAIVPGGILLDQDISNETLEILLNHVSKNLSQRSIYIEIRNYNDFVPFRSLFENCGFKYQKHLNFHVSTTNIEFALKQLSSSKRRQIKQTINAGATISVAETTEDIKQFYQLLKDLYRTKVRLPLFPILFFENLNALPNGKIILIRHKDKVVGGIVCVLLKNKTVYEWFVCGKDTVEKNLYPSVLATWAGIEYASKNGYERFDFMGAGKPDESYGVREFKSKFGGELVENGRFLYICKPHLYTLGKYIVQKLKK